MNRGPEAVKTFEAVSYFHLVHFLKCRMKRRLQFQ
jgi:hypothetical protein